MKRIETRIAHVWLKTESFCYRVLVDSFDGVGMLVLPKGAIITRLRRRVTSDGHTLISGDYLGMSPFYCGSNNTKVMPLKRKEHFLGSYRYQITVMEGIKLIESYHTHSLRHLLAMERVFLARSPAYTVCISGTKWQRVNGVVTCER